MNKLLIISLLPILFIITSCDSNEAIYCPGGSYGCDSVCGSDTIIDDCGICGGLNASMDSDGECCEDAVVDECGVCGGDDSLCADGCGVPNGLNPFIPYDDCNFSCDYTIDDTCGYWLSEGYSCTELIEMGHDCSSCESEGFCANPNLFDMEGLCGVTGDDVDCMGVCFGTSLIDDCSDCSLPENFNSSKDNCGLCYGGNADQDCAGVCFGDAWESDCGCVSGPNFGNDCDDCTGTPNGNAVIDDCDVCDGGNADQDCTGVCFGDSVLDDCDVCDGGNADQDCAGVCFGDSVLDDCDVCDGGNADQDCAGVCFGSSVLDDCDVCDGGNADQDCAGVCFGGSVLDDCDVCDGGNADQDCAGVCFGSSVLDDCDVCDSNLENNCTQDCNGDWGGSAIVDECDICDSDSNNNCTFNILYNSNIDFSGFQFNVEGIISASGGAAEDAGLPVFVTEGSDVVLGFDISGAATINAGTGIILTTITLDAGSSNPCITDIAVSDSDGNTLNISLSECLTIVVTGG